MASTLEIVDHGATAARWPDFFIVGAARSGTTTLFEYLRRHPDVFLPLLKEPNYFARFPPGSLPTPRVTDQHDYLKLFRPGAKKLRLGDASVWYLYDPSAAQRIYQVAPHARILVILRNPVERAHSGYLLHRRNTVEERPFFEAIVEDNTQQLRELGPTHHYVGFGLYYEAVKRYLDIFGGEHVRVFLTEDLEGNPTKLVRDVCHFLGISFYEGRFFDPGRRYNEFTVPRSRLSKYINRQIAKVQRLKELLFAVFPEDILRAIYLSLLFTPVPKPLLDPRASEYLHSIYDDDIRKLEKLIGRDLSSWL